jgi:hypothetical protein
MVGRRAREQALGWHGAQIRHELEQPSRAGGFRQGRGTNQRLLSRCSEPQENRMCDFCAQRVTEYYQSV